MTEKQPFEGYWAESENFVLERMKKLVHTYPKNKRDTYFLDAGCGTGRLLFEFQSYFDRMLAIDPDAHLLEIAKEAARNSRLSQKVIFQHTSIEKLDWKERNIDVILCSHVLQHAHTDSLKGILAKFEQLMADNGQLFITTCHSVRNSDFYTKMYLKEQRVVEEAIDKDEFNFLINNEKNVLPIHFFSEKDLLRTLNNFGFEMVDFKSFHILNKIPLVDRLVFRDKLVNALPPLQSRLGRDMFIACRRI
jgi:ubiquinone/menaquinone biosynthesis C-methylase UbiE